MRRGTADALGDNQRVRLEDDAVVDDLVDGEGDEVVVFDDGAFVDGLSVGDVVSWRRGERGRMERGKGD